IVAVCGGQIAATDSSQSFRPIGVLERTDPPPTVLVEGAPKGCSGQFVFVGEVRIKGALGQSGIRHHWGDGGAGQTFAPESYGSGVQNSVERIHFLVGALNHSIPMSTTI